MIVETILRAVRKRPITIDDDAPLIAAARSLSDLDADVVVVHDHDGMLVGVITETDIVRQISHCQGTSCMAAASAVMTKAIVSCRPGDLLRDVWSLMKERCLKNILPPKQTRRHLRKASLIDVAVMEAATAFTLARAGDMPDDY